VNEFVASLLGTIAGMSIAFAALRYLTSSLVEHQLAKALARHSHDLARQLASVEAQLNRVGDVLSRRNEREFAVTEAAWDLLIRAIGEAQSRFGGLRRVPVFLTMDDAEALRVIDSLPFDEPEKTALRDAGGEERDRLYAQYARRDDIRVSLKAWAEFKNFVNTRQIFLSGSVHGAMLDIRDQLYRLLIRIEMHARRGEDLPAEQQENAHDVLMVELNAKIDALALVIRQRFGFSEKDADTGPAVETSAG
jgi:hypothetical protein